jgi:hypothetical protein
MIMKGENGEYDKLHTIQIFLFSCFAPYPKGSRKREKFENLLYGT